MFPSSKQPPACTSQHLAGESKAFQLTELMCVLSPKPSTAEDILPLVRPPRRTCESAWSGTAAAERVVLYWGAAASEATGWDRAWKPLRRVKHAGKKPLYTLQDIPSSVALTLPTWYWRVRWVPGCRSGDQACLSCGPTCAVSFLRSVMTSLRTCGREGQSCAPVGIARS